MSKILNFCERNLIFIMFLTWMFLLPYCYKKEILEANSIVIGGFFICLYSMAILDDNIKKRTKILEEIKETLDKIKEKQDDRAPNDN